MIEYKHNYTYKDKSFYRVEREPVVITDTAEYMTLGYIQRCFRGKNFEVWDAATGGNTFVLGDDYVLSAGFVDQAYTKVIGEACYGAFRFKRDTRTVYVSYDCVATYSSGDIINEHEERLDDAEISIDNIASRLDAIVNKNNEEDGRLDAIETKNLEQDSRISAHDGDLESFDTRLDTAETDIDNLETRVDTAEGDLVTLRTQLENVVVSGGSSDLIDGFHAAATPTPNTLLALNADAKLPASITGNAETASDAVLFGGQSPSYYQDAANLASGALARGRLSGTYDIDITGTAKPDVAHAPIPGSTLRIDLKYFQCSADYPWWNIGQPNKTISAEQYPDLTDAMRNFAAAFEPWGDNKSTFSVASATRSSNVATITLAKNDWLSGTVTANGPTALTFSVSQTIPAGSVLILESGPIINVRDAVSGTSGVADTEIRASASRVRIATYEELLVRAIAEARLKHGSYTDWFCVTLSAAIGTISAGDYAITGVSVANNTISFAASGADCSFTEPFSNVIQLFPFRIPGSTDARHYSIAGHTLVAHGDRDRSIMAGFMRLDYMQGFRVVAARSKAWDNQSGGWDSSGNDDVVILPENDGLHGTPRTAKTTHGADVGVNFCVYVGRVI